MIPFYDVSAMGGSKKGADMEAVVNPSGYIDIGDELRESQAAMRVYGNSMMPNYPSGCVVGLKPVNDNIIEYGKVYVVETDDNRYVKRLYKSDEGLLCYNDNIALFTEGSRKGLPYYEEFTIPFESVRKVHRVIGVIKRNENSLII